MEVTPRARARARSSTRRYSPEAPPRRPKKGRSEGTDGRKLASPADRTGAHTRAAPAGGEPCAAPTDTAPPRRPGPRSAEAASVAVRAGERAGAGLVTSGTRSAGHSRCSRQAAGAGRGSLRGPARAATGAPATFCVTSCRRRRLPEDTRSQEETSQPSQIWEKKYGMCFTAD